jgi:hypothetical protein
MDIWNCPECSKEIVEPPRRGPHLSACRRSKKSQFFYNDISDPNHKHPLEERNCEHCGKVFLGRRDRGARFCNRSCSQFGRNNSNYNLNKKAHKPVLPSYYTIHSKLSEQRGSAKTHRCFCGERANVWANLTGLYEDDEDYAPMCARCHKRYDNGRASMGDIAGWKDYLERRKLDISE